MLPTIFETIRNGHPSFFIANNQWIILLSLLCEWIYIYIYIDIYIYISIVDVDLEGIYVKILEIFDCKYMYRNKERNEKVKKEIDFGFALAP